MTHDIKLKTDNSGVFLVDAYRTIEAFVDIYHFLTGDRTKCMTDDFKELGISPDEAVLYTLEEKIAPVSLKTTYDIIRSNSLHLGIATSKFLSGAVRLEDACYKTLQLRISQIRPFTEEEYASLCDAISYGLGDYIYAINQIIDARGLAAAICTDEPDMRLCAPLIHMFSQPRMQMSTVVANLVNWQAEFVSIAPAFIDRPATWKELTKDLDPGLVDMLTTYGDYVFPIDLRAFKLGVLTVDDSYLDLVMHRSENEQHICKLYPHEWMKFQDAVPDDLVGDVYDIEEFITIGMIDPVVSEGQPFTRELLEHIKTHLNEYMQPSVKTSKFAGNV